MTTFFLSPAWGVTANLMVCGSRFNHTINFKDIYPKTGGGEDIDFVYQHKAFYPHLGKRAIVAVPEAVVHHPWWKNGNVCYSQINGWAKGDSICLTEWPEKTFLTCPNWIGHACFIILPYAALTRRPLAGLVAAGAVIGLEHFILACKFWGEAMEQCKDGEPFAKIRSTLKWILETTLVAVGAGTVLTAQEATRSWWMVRRATFFSSMCRRVDWFDGQRPAIKLDIQLNSMAQFVVNSAITWGCWKLFD